MCILYWLCKILPDLAMLQVALLNFILGVLWCAIVLSCLRNRCTVSVLFVSNCVGFFQIRCAQNCILLDHFRCDWTHTPQKTTPESFDVHLKSQFLLSNFSKMSKIMNQNDKTNDILHNVALFKHCQCAAIFNCFDNSHRAYKTP